MAFVVAPRSVAKMGATVHPINLPLLVLLQEERSTGTMEEPLLKFVWTSSYAWCGVDRSGYEKVSCGPPITGCRNDASCGAVKPISTFSLRPHSHGLFPANE